MPGDALLAAGLVVAVMLVAGLVVAVMLVAVLVVAVMLVAVLVVPVILVVVMPMILVVVMPGEPSCSRHRDNGWVAIPVVGVIDLNAALAAPRWKVSWVVLIPIYEHILAKHGLNIFLL
jgi:hypothetical protein